MSLLNGTDKNEVAEKVVQVFRLVHGAINLNHVRCLMKNIRLKVFHVDPLAQKAVLLHPSDGAKIYCIGWQWSCIVFTIFKFMTFSITAVFNNKNRKTKNELD